MNKILLTIILAFFHLTSSGQQFFLRNIDEFAIQLDFSELAHFLDTNDRSDFHELSITFNDSVVFKNVSPFSKTRLEMKEENELLLTLVIAIPVDTVWKWIDILKIKFSHDKSGNVVLKTSPLEDQYRPSQQQINQTLEKRMDMISDTSYTTEDWNQISKTESEAVLRLSGELFHCAFYENRACQKSFESLQVDFNVMYAGYLAETYSTFKEILRIKNTVPNNK